MSRVLVLDASVALKWFFRHDADDVDLAAALLAAVGQGSVRLIEPPHFVAEVAGVLARRVPQTADLHLRDLLGAGFELRADASLYARAVRLAIDLDHHLFDTLYHAVAIETPGACFVTTDQRYLRKARQLSDPRICALADAGALL